MKRIASSFFGGLGIAILVFVFLWKELVISLSNANILLVFIAGILYFLSILLWAIRWKIFIERKISVRELLPVIFAGMAVNSLTPLARAGGEPVRAYLLKIKKDISFSESMATSLSELVPEFIIQLIIVIFSFPLLLYYFNLPLWIIAAYGIFVFVYFLLGIGILGIQDERKINRVFMWLSFKSKRFSVMRARIAKKFFSFQNDFKKSLADREKLVKGVLISLLMKFIEIIKIFLIFYSLENPIPLFIAFIVLGVALVLSSIPATPGSLGIIEGGIISFLILIGVSPGIAAGFVLIDRVITFWLPMLIGIITLYYYGISLKFVQKIGKKKVF